MEQNKKYYLVQGSDGSYGFVEYDKDNKTLNYTFQTKDGKLDIDYALLKEMVYYLQEVVAPEGYDIDTTVYVICDESEDGSVYEKACEMLQDAAVDKSKGFEYAGAINAAKTLNIQIVNQVTPPTPSTGELEEPKTPETETPETETPQTETTQTETPQTESEEMPTPTSGELVEETETEAVTEEVTETKTETTTVETEEEEQATEAIVSSGAVKTGDNSSMLMWAMAMIASGMAAAGAMLRRKKFF